MSLLYMSHEIIKIRRSMWESNDLSTFHDSMRIEKHVPVIHVLFQEEEEEVVAYFAV